MKVTTTYRGYTIYVYLTEGANHITVITGSVYSKTIAPADSWLSTAVHMYYSNQYADLTLAEWLDKVGPPIS